MSLHLSPDLNLPQKAATQIFAILAKRGVGKSYLSMVMVEEMLKNNLQVVYVDPIGVAWGLRTSADGQSPGYPIIIAGGEHGDIPLDPSNGEIIAEVRTVTLYHYSPQRLSVIACLKSGLRS